MKQIQTEAIVLTRTDFGEADRIITMLTPDLGKLRLMARGVRKPKSKLAGGVELFSVSEISFIRGRGEISTLVSSRLKTHYGQIVKNIDRVQLGYNLIKILNRATEDEPEPEYFELISQALVALNDDRIDADLIRTWFQAQLLRLGGHTPNLLTDTDGQKLTADQTYNFDFDAMSFNSGDRFAASHIKSLRLMFTQALPNLTRISNLDSQLPIIEPLIRTMAQNYLRT